MKKNTGKEFERLTESIYKKLVVNEELENVEHNVKVQGQDGPRQIDVLLTTKSCGITFTTAIECKDYNQKISVGTIDAFHSKLIDINASKGVLISKKGFSSTAVQKAERVGITLCTAHEALKDSWNPDFDIPVLIKEVTPEDFNFSHEVHLNEGDTISTVDFPVINDINLKEIVEKKWEEGTLKYQPTQSKQEIEVGEIKAPYYLKTVQGELREVSTFTITIRFRHRCFLVNLRELEGTQILQNITDNMTHLFAAIPSIDSLEGNFKKVPTSVERNFTGIVFGLHVIPKLNDKPYRMEVTKIN